MGKKSTCVPSTCLPQASGLLDYIWMEAPNTGPKDPMEETEGRRSNSPNPEGSCSLLHLPSPSPDQGECGVAAREHFHVGGDGKVDSPVLVAVPTGIHPLQSTSTGRARGNSPSGHKIYESPRKLADPVGLRIPRV
jgi:hypothetical protein